MSSPKVESGKSIWDAKDLSNLFNHKILPMVEEFCHGNQGQLLAILGNDLPKRLEPDEFIPAVENFIND